MIKGELNSRQHKQTAHQDGRRPGWVGSLHCSSLISPIPGVPDHQSTLFSRTFRITFVVENYVSGKLLRRIWCCMLTVFLCAYYFLLCPFTQRSLHYSRLNWTNKALTAKLTNKRSLKTQPYRARHVPTPT